MRNFSEKEIEKYIKYFDENMVDINEVKGFCHIGGKSLKDSELPKGAEKRVVCLEDLDVFIEIFTEFEEENAL